MGETAAPGPDWEALAEALRVRLLLIIDDEPQIRRAVRNACSGIADGVAEAGTGSEGIDLAATQLPDLVILDLGLPDIPGLEVCREIRRWSAAPIVVLSVRHAEQEKVRLLNAGADDYVTKPFSARELAARVRAQLRRTLAAAPRAGASVLEVGGLAIDLARRTVAREGTPVHLTPIEWQILRTLAVHAGRTLTHQQIFDAVWGREFGNPQQYLRVHITNLRRKIEVNPAHPLVVLTEPGVGYRVEL